MKIVLLGCTLFFSAISFAKDAAPQKNRTPSQASNITVRCEGVRADKVRIGLDVTLDPVERLVSVTSFENESTAPIELKALMAPSHYVERLNNGELKMFGFKTFNDGLERDLYVYYTKSSRNNKLQLSYLPTQKAVSDISCRILK